MNIDLGNAWNTAMSGYRSDNPLERGAWAGGTAVATIGTAAVARGGFNMIGGRPTGGAVMMGRVAATAAVAGFGLGTISGIRLSDDRFVGAWQGFGLGAAIGGGSAGTIAGTWMLGKNVTHQGARVAGATMAGAAGAAMLYGALGASGLISHK